MSRRPSESNVILNLKRTSSVMNKYMDRTQGDIHEDFVAVSNWLVALATKMEVEQRRIEAEAKAREKEQDEARADSGTSAVLC